jgi:hypothetical protein
LRRFALRRLRRFALLMCDERGIPPRPVPINHGATEICHQSIMGQSMKRRQGGTSTDEAPRDRFCIKQEPVRQDTRQARGPKNRQEVSVDPGGYRGTVSNERRSTAVVLAAR